MITWSEYIRHDLIGKICSGHGVPEKLTLDSLSQQYEVSLTPVRMAVRGLIDEGFLIKSDNGRLLINAERIGSGGPATTLPRPQPSEGHYDQIARDLVPLSFSDKPVFLRETRMAEQYGVSRTAVRQILNWLAGVGMVEHVPRRGWRVRPFRQEDLAAYIEVRETLELKALELAWPQLVDDDLQRMYDGNVLPAGNGQQPIIDNTLHGYIITKADNRYITDFFGRHGKYYETFFRWEEADRQSAIATVHQHRAILGAMLARDRRAARAALVAHIRFRHPVLTERGTMTKPENRRPKP